MSTAFTGSSVQRHDWWSKKLLCFQPLWKSTDSTWPKVSAQHHIIRYSWYQKARHWMKVCIHIPEAWSWLHKGWRQRPDLFWDKVKFLMTKSPSSLWCLQVSIISSLNFCPCSIIFIHFISFRSPWLSWCPYFFMVFRSSWPSWSSFPLGLHCFMVYMAFITFIVPWTVHL